LAIPLNLWNVMEYSIGFCGGLGMAYAVFTTAWPVAEKGRNRNSNLLAIFLLMVFIPFVVWDQSFTTEKLNALLEKGGTTQWVVAVQYIAILSIVVMAVIAFTQSNRNDTKPGYSFTATRNIFIAYIGVFTFLSFLVTGVDVHPVEQYLYIANIIIFLVFARKVDIYFTVPAERRGIQLAAFLAVMLVLAISAAVMINSHEEIKGSQVRFPR